MPRRGSARSSMPAPGSRAKPACRMCWPASPSPVVAGNRKLGALMVPPFLTEKHGYREGAEPSDALLEDFALHFSPTVYHPTSTCRIGDVVDPRLRVKEIGRLRVADANVMPAVIGGNTNAPAIMIGEKFSGCCGDRPHAKTQD